jgi:hypothetical protein
MRLRYVILMVMIFSPVLAHEDAEIYTFEQVDIMPSQFEGQSVVISGGLQVHPNIEKLSRDFEDGTHGVRVYSDKLYSGVLQDDYLNILAGPNLSYTIINSLSDYDDYFDARITGNVAQITTLRGDTYWTFYITKIEMLDADGEPTEELTDAEITPIENPVLAERERWDAGNDNRIGLEEAVRALQIIVDRTE